MIPQNYLNWLLLALIIVFFSYMILRFPANWDNERNPSNSTFREIEIYCWWYENKGTDELCDELDKFYYQYYDLRMRYNYILELYKAKW